MSYFVSTITAEAALVFFLLGCGYRAAYSLLLLACKAINAPAGVANLFKSALRGDSAATAKTAFFNIAREKAGIPDILHAILILIFGGLLTLSAYALCDGVPRLYTLLLASLGYLAVFFLQKAGFKDLTSRGLFTIAYAVIRAFLFPLCLIKRIRRLLRKNNKS